MQSKEVPTHFTFLVESSKILSFEVSLLVLNRSMSSSLYNSRNDTLTENSDSWHHASTNKWKRQHSSNTDVTLSMHAYTHTHILVPVVLVAGKVDATNVEWLQPGDPADDITVMMHRYCKKLIQTIFSMQQSIMACVNISSPANDSIAMRWEHLQEYLKNRMDCRS